MSTNGPIRDSIVIKQDNIQYETISSNNISDRSNYINDYTTGNIYYYDKDFNTVTLPTQWTTSNPSVNISFTQEPFLDILIKAKRLPGSDLDKMIIELIRFKDQCGLNEIGS